MAESGFLVASRRGRANLLDEVHIWRHACIRDSNGRRSGTRLGDREYRGEGQPIGPPQSVHSGMHSSRSLTLRRACPSPVRASSPENRLFRTAPSINVTVRCFRGPV
jgi:hypothetical protein